MRKILTWGNAKMKRSLVSAIVLGLAAIVISCDEPEEYRIEGDWHAINEQFGPSYKIIYIGDWRINKDGTYYLEFSLSPGDIGGTIIGYSSGEYQMLSDSIMILTSLEHEHLDFNHLFRKTADTLFIELHNSALTTLNATLVGQSMFEKTGIKVDWDRE